MLLRSCLLPSLFLALWPAVALAQRDASREALSRLEETLAGRLEDGAVQLRSLTPAMVVSVLPAYEETRAWYPNAALASLVRVFGAAGLRACEACMAPRLSVEEGRLEQSSALPTVAEIVRLDETARGSAAPARSAIFLDETEQGVSLRIVDLSNSRIVLAENFDPALSERARSTRNFTLTRELDRRARGDSLTHIFFDAALYPGQHVSVDWTEQWGETNANLSGITLSLFDPVLGVGANYHRVFPSALNVTVGAKVLLSVPSAIATGVSGQAQALIDPLLTGTLLVRVPIASSSYGIILSASTNGRIGVGISLMNFSLIPVLP